MTVVVIVDDQAINLKILARFARSLAKDVRAKPFTDPGEALDFVAEGSADLIVTDYVMPVMNGAEFIQSCRSLSVARDVPIIVVTAFEDREFRYRALEAGASDFLLSPVDGQEFRTRARNLLLLWRHQRLLEERAHTLQDELDTAVRQHAEEIRAREEHLRRVLDTVPVLIRATDRDGRIVILNSYHRHLFDLDLDQMLVGCKEQLFGPAYASRHVRLDRQVLASGEMADGIEEIVRDRDNRERVLLTTKAPLRGNDPRLDQVVTVSLDITHRKQVEQAVRESESRFRSLVEGSVLGIVIERDGIPIFANHTFARIFGYRAPEEILALPSLDAVLAPGELRRVNQLRRSGAWAPSPAEPREFQGRTKDGALIWVEILTQEVQWQNASAFQSTVVDITLRKAYEERLQRQANFDETTGLPNRVLALDRLRRAVVSAVRHHHKGGVLFIDLDHFKKINDTWGHAIGDQLLKLAAERLRSCVREEDTVARLGGDEFIIILPNIATASHTEPVIQKILNAFSLPFALGPHEAFVSASIGVTVFPDDSEDPAILMQNADAAMYRSKAQGRNTFEYYTPELNERALRRMRMESQLVHAVERGELLLHYQPILDVRSGQLTGCEALLRWRNDDLGVLEPDVFIPLAEDTGLIVAIGRWALDAACGQLALWHRMGLPHLGLSVNVCSRQLHGRGLVESVSNSLQRHGIPAACLELEITEGCLMYDLKEIGAALQALDQLGVRLALDDFGTGYSCLSHLKELPVDTVKIDKSFVLNVASDPGNATVVEAIIAMAHRLGVRVVGEGVETLEQLEFIRQRGCDLAQGFYFSRPLSATDFGGWCRMWHQEQHQAFA